MQRAGQAASRRQDSACWPSSGMDGRLPWDEVVEVAYHGLPGPPSLPCPPAPAPLTTPGPPPTPGPHHARCRHCSGPGSVPRPCSCPLAERCGEFPP